MIDNLSQKEKKQLNVIGEKKQKKQTLSAKEQNILDSFLSKAKESDKGLSKLREWAETKYQLAEPIKSENFKKWFGDWENDPKNASKVVNEKGEPLLMYHGSPEKFTIFDSDFMSLNGSSKGYGFYFSPDKNMAQWYWDVMQVYLDVKNPLSQDKISITRQQMKKLILDVEKNIAQKWGNEDGSLLDNFGDTRRYGRDRVLEDAIDMLMENENDIDVFWELKNIGGDYDSVAKSFREVLKKDGIITPKEYIVFDPSQIKSATDNIWTFDPNNPDIRYQKHWVANPLEKNISAERATQLQNIRNGRSVQELADHYGIDIQTVEKIATPEGVKAYGKYGDWIITLAEKIKEWTASHELFHATFDLVDSRRKENILKQIEKSKGLDSLNAEEYLADSFSEYFRTGKFDTKSFGKGLIGKIKQFFYEVKQFISGANKNKDQVKKLFDEILDGEIDREMLGEVLGKEKKHSATRPTEKFNRETMQNARKSSSTTSLAGALERSSGKSITISPKNANLYRENLKQIGENIHKYSPESFLRELKNSFGVEGDSSYISNNLSDWTYTLRISNHSAKAWNNKLRGHPENNTSIVIKLADTKFKRNKSVDLIEFVYDPANLTPEKMQGIIKGIQDWIDTGEYTDKGYDHTHKSIRASLEKGEVKYQLVYHWSPYEFTKFDSAHMGAGEGGQAHWWGHYVAVDKTTARNYATMRWWIVEYKWKPLKDFFDSNDWSTYSSLEKEVISDIANNISEYFDKPEEARDRAQMEYERAIRNNEDVLYNKSKLNSLRSLDYDDFVDRGGNTYEVEIPDPVKANTPTGKNYWEEQWKIKSRAVDAIVKQLKKWLPQEKIIELDELIDSWESGYDHSIEGWRMYRMIANTLGSDQKASKFLQSLGYDGIHYHGGRDWEVYVIFDDNKLEIKKHEKL